MGSHHGPLGLSYSTYSGSSGGGTSVASTKGQRVFRFPARGPCVLTQRKLLAKMQVQQLEVGLSARYEGPVVGPAHVSKRGTMACPG